MYLFGVIDVATLFYKGDQTKHSLTEVDSKNSFILGRP
jgi:hypothetical protein